MDSAAQSFSELRFLKGVGPKKALIFQKIGISSIRDLLYFFPRRYEDRSHLLPLKSLPIGEFATCRGEILDVKFRPIRRMPIVEVLIGDADGTLLAVWYNQPYLKRLFSVGQNIIFYGRIEPHQTFLKIQNPDFEIVDSFEAEALHTGRITPIYHLKEGIFQRSLRATLFDAVQNHLAKNIQDFLPAEILNRHNLSQLQTAVREMHFPTSFEKLKKARERVVFDEFFAFDLRVRLKVKMLRTRFESEEVSSTLNLLEQFKASLPFDLTKSQETAIVDIQNDLSKAIPMNRLLQGDVGSGKTVVAAFAFYLVAKAGYQSAFLVPTEILAEQHMKTLKRFLDPLGVRIELLTKSTKKNRRAQILGDLKEGRLSLIVGTHSILQNEVTFKKLVFLGVDEQHKFGVRQRTQLLNRSPRPHLLTMTATPIPRTLELTTFADLDISVLRELPKGRRPIKTYWITRAKQSIVFARVIERIKKGEQAYIVFPAIEETEKSDILAAEKEFAKLSKTIFKNVSTALVHGQIESSEREQIMRAFSRGEISILFATSVIEVGVDQPNATIMIIENAERFGLAQLHQLRGRIGRGVIESECFLFGEPNSIEGKKRLRLLTTTTDGFEIAEEDLKIRGPGDIWGTRQSGEPLFKVADPITDQAILIKARSEAMRWVSDNKSSEKKSVWIQKYLEQMPKTD